MLSSLCFILMSCSPSSDQVLDGAADTIDSIIEIPDIWVSDTLLIYDKMTSQYTLNDELFSGYSVNYYSDNSVKTQIGISNGKKQNQSIRWFRDGHYQMIANYQQGKLHGEQKKWSSDTSHILLSILNYNVGKAHGAQIYWYPSGELFKKLNMYMGKEDGLQQAFRKNGDLYANYEAKNGRTFGLRKAALCFGLDDEKVQYAD